MAGAAKSGKKTKVVTLTLSPEVLAQFPKTEASSPASDTADTKRSLHGTNLDTSVDDQSESNATPAPVNGNGTAEQTQDDKKKKVTATKKRAPPAIDPDGPARERGRPGPKKKARLTDGAEERADSAKPAASANASSGIAAHKLGPRANTGAINAGLRALDRSGKPCRRWAKKGLQLKSFTGTVWNMSSWKGSHQPKLNADGEVQSDSSSDVKPDTSVVASEKSASGTLPGGNDTLDVVNTNVLESSPAPAITVS